MTILIMSSGSSNNLTGGARVHRYNSEILLRIKPICDSYKTWRCHPFIYEDIRAHHQGHWMHRMGTNRIRQVGFILDQPDHHATECSTWCSTQSSTFSMTIKPIVDCGKPLGGS